GEIRVVEARATVDDDQRPSSAGAPDVVPELSPRSVEGLPRIRFRRPRASRSRAPDDDCDEYRQPVSHATSRVSSALLAQARCADDISLTSTVVLSGARPREVKVSPSLPGRAPGSGENRRAGHACPDHEGAAGCALGPKSKRLERGCVSGAL